MNYAIHILNLLSFNNDSVKRISVHLSLSSFCRFVQGRQLESETVKKQRLQCLLDVIIIYVSSFT